MQCETESRNVLSATHAVHRLYRFESTDPTVMSTRTGIMSISRNAHDDIKHPCFRGSPVPLLARWHRVTTLRIHHGFPSASKHTAHTGSHTRGAVRKKGGTLCAPPCWASCASRVPLMGIPGFLPGFSRLLSLTVIIANDKVHARVLQFYYLA